MQLPHISVCVCTYRRRELLSRLLDALERQTTKGRFTYSVVVSDNDSARSAEDVVNEFCAKNLTSVAYSVEPRQNIAMARNRALQSAEGDFIAFIDDDEIPGHDWLYSLLEAQAAYGADGVLGPVRPHFECDPPRWVTKGGFFDRPTYPTGYKVNWYEARTGNVLFKRSILSGFDSPFRPEFATAGEDMDFFRRMMDQGYAFVWCDEAAVYETVPQSRCNRRYLLRRALLRGSNFPKHPTDRLKNTVKSLIAVPCYTLALPLLAILAQHLFVSYLIKLCDHCSRLLAFLGFRLITERET